jgi:thiosulfate reductase cytochrome b subunit
MLNEANTHAPLREAGAARPVSIRRHALAIRITHWLNVICFGVLLMSGLQILNAHPALYWGNDSDFAHPLAEIAAKKSETGEKRGVLAILDHRFDTTGVLGYFPFGDGRALARAFPAWATLPGWYSLADGRRWHFFFAWVLVFNGLIYWLYGLASRHVWRDLVPSRTGMRHIFRVAWDHLRLRFPHGEEARHYNAIQQLTYLVVVGVLFPLMILTGLTMSPRLDAEFPFLVSLFGGRQSARTLHFIVAFSLVAFLVVHLVMVLLSGFWNNLRSMVTGRYVIQPEARRDA